VFVNLENVPSLIDMKERVGLSGETEYVDVIFVHRVQLELRVKYVEKDEARATTIKRFISRFGCEVMYRCYAISC
jgi:hypothetical protein